MASVKPVTVPFSQWAQRVQEVSSTSPIELYKDSGNSHPFSSTACIKSCCGLLGAIDRDHLGKECCKELLSHGVFKMLGEATAADWNGISEGLKQRAGMYANEPAWLQDSLERCVAPVSQRLQRACCSSEVAVLMLRLAVRTACLASSWYGPWGEPGGAEAARQG